MAKNRDRPAVSVTKSPTSSAEPQDDGFPVVAIGASAGGLEALQSFFDATPADSGLAYVVVQHLDPTHESMMVALLAGHTAMTVQQAADGMPIERDNAYVIPPGYFLSIRDGVFRLTKPDEPHGVRLPFDFLLRSMALELGNRAICVILSGTGSDGSVGLKSVKEEAGLVIAQDPGEAAFDGMPANAIKTGLVDMVLPIAAIPEAIVRFANRVAITSRMPRSRTGDHDQVSEIIELLHNRTSHDFASYKRGTLERRIGRRRAMAPGGSDNIDEYVKTLLDDPDELDNLVKDLLINVTGFFRDPWVYDYLATDVVPALLRDCEPDEAIRIWSVGCSSGEEAYSLAMLFAEAATEQKHKTRVQIFGSDADADAIEQARAGVYPRAIEAEVSPERLARFFTKEDHHYKIAPELREMVVFTNHDILQDPPFSRINLISCRNVLIYLTPEAQSRVISLFHFALREKGLLLLGGSEMVAADDKRFAVISKKARLYRHLGRARAGDLTRTLNTGGDSTARALSDAAMQPLRRTPYEELCRQTLLETYAPAAILVDGNLESVYSFGPTDLYLRIPAGYTRQNVMAMLRQPELRSRLRAAITQAGKENTKIVLSGGRIEGPADTHRYSIAIHPLSREDEKFVLICFVDEPEPERRAQGKGAPENVARAPELEQELEATKAELQLVSRDLTEAIEKQNAIEEEALSVNEEFQSTNEELLTSKEELQSLNEELVALNTQLQETLDVQRAASNDLQNILYSTDVATIFLDPELKIRFFTPAARNIFSLISSDIGRPLSDLRAFADDDNTLGHARAVITSLSAIEDQVSFTNGTWFDRRIMPYRTQDDTVEGVVITFSDISARKRAEQILADAQRSAEEANIAKSRFLAAASHDLRQPLQTIALIQGVLERVVEGEKAQKLIGQLDHTLTAMSGMLNTLLDINQIDTGTIAVEMETFAIGEMLGRLRDEFAYQALALGLDLRVMPCSLKIRSDPRLLEQMLRNLISNALKYTKRGKVLVGCRRRHGSVSIEIWDTGQGIPEAELQAIFDEYHQIDNPARQLERGLGLGLAIVQRLSALLGHQVDVRSQLGKGSAFAVEIAFDEDEATSRLDNEKRVAGDSPAAERRDGSMILVVEDDPDVRALLEIILTHDGHQVVAACDGGEAAALITQDAVQPDLILSDFNLPGGMDGLDVAAKLREILHRAVPFVILTGDISVATQQKIAQHDCALLSKPLKAGELLRVIEERLATPRAEASGEIGSPAVRATNQTGNRVAPPSDHAERPVVYVVDDDTEVRNMLRIALEDAGYAVEEFSNAEAFLEASRTKDEHCLLIDVALPGMSGLELLGKLHDAARSVPSIVITAFGDLPMAVEAMRCGALDLIEKPFKHKELIKRVARAFDLSRDAARRAAWHDEAETRISSLTARQREIMELILAGHPNKNIAADLGISQRTVESHRAAIMKKTGSKSLPELARLAVTAGMV